MLKEERHQYIINQISQNYRVYISALSTELGVSDDTLRRDITELDERGILTKVHGGAIAKSGIPFEFTGRMNTAIAGKREMAAKVIPLFRPGDIILIDGGTSNLEVARQLPKDMELIVYTNSFPIVDALLEHPKLELNFLGGKVFPSAQVAIGNSVWQALQMVRPDWLLLGVYSVHPQLGLTIPASDREEIMLKRLMLERSRKRVVLADGNKLNRAEPYTIASLDEIDYLVTEDSKLEYVKTHWPKGLYTVI